jgi:hypothetical protein
MSNEAIVKTGTQKTLEASGAAIANNALAQADDASYGIVADGLSYPDARFVLTGTFSVAPTENSTLALYARPLNIDGTADADAPETTRPTQFIGVFIVNNVTTAQSLVCDAQDVPWEADYYIHNNGTGQTLSAGWKLLVTPCTIGPAA